MLGGMLQWLAELEELGVAHLPTPVGKFLGDFAAGVGLPPVDFLVVLVLLIQMPIGSVYMVWLCCWKSD